jgi:hypothetical protein
MSRNTIIIFHIKKVYSNCFNGRETLYLIVTVVIRVQENRSKKQREMYNIT